LPRRVHERELAPGDFVGSTTVGPPTPALPKGKPEKIIILIPGIRTNAEWTDVASRRFETFADPIRAYKSHGGRISSFNLITRIGLTKIRDDIARQIVTIITENRTSRISLVCHSMGTDIILDIIDDLPIMTFDYIFFLGAVSHKNKIRRLYRSCRTFVNHVGVRDPWPILAWLIRPDKYSPIGTFGVGKAIYVNDIQFDNDHESCTHIEHVLTYILPVLNGNTPQYPAPERVPQVFNQNTATYLRRTCYLSLAVSVLVILYYTKMSLRVSINGTTLVALLAAPLIIVAGAVVFYLHKRRVTRAGVTQRNDI
jgi:hypothetical protein